MVLLYAIKIRKKRRTWADCGVVLAVICLKMFYLRHILVGARKRWTQKLYLAYHLIHVVRLVREIANSQEHAHTLVIRYVMPVHVHPVQVWDLHSHASVENNPPVADVPKPNMKLVGAVVKYVATSCLVVTIFVNALVTKESVVHAQLT